MDDVPSCAVLHRRPGGRDVGGVISVSLLGFLNLVGPGINFIEDSLSSKSWNVYLAVLMKLPINSPSQHFLPVQSDVISGFDLLIRLIVRFRPRRVASTWASQLFAHNGYSTSSCYICPFRSSFAPAPPRSLHCCVARAPLPPSPQHLCCAVLARWL